jgi:hypothetical protein
LSDLIERLRPSAVADTEVDGAVRALRGAGFAMLAGSLNEWLVENNALKSEAATALSEAKAENERLTRERDAFFDSLRRLICINSVLTALRSTAPLWLEHAERLIDERNAALNPKGGDNGEG